MKKGFVAGIMALVAVVAFSGRAMAEIPSPVTPGIQDIHANVQMPVSLKDTDGDGCADIHDTQPTDPAVGCFLAATPVFPVKPLAKILFSDSVADYSAVIHGDTDAVLYGKLADGVKEADLSTFEEVGEANLLNATLKDKFDAIKDKSMLMWFSFKPIISLPDFFVSTPMVSSTCEVLKDGVHFRCYGFFGGETKDITWSVRAAALSTAPGPELKIMDLLSASADADADGVPDAIDGCESADSFADPLAECVDPDSDDDGVADADDPCPADPLDACVQPPDSDGDGVADIDDACPSDPADACVDPNAGAGDEVPVVPVADDGGSCSLNPSATANPIAFLVIAFGLLPLAWRRKV